VVPHKRSRPFLRLHLARLFGDAPRLYLYRLSSRSIDIVFAAALKWIELAVTRWDFDMCSLAEGDRFYRGGLDWGLFADKVIANCYFK
jgi:hypothetical protein